MEELKQKLAEVLNLDEEMAQKGVDTVVEFLKGKLPENMHGMLENLDAGDLAKQAEGVLGAVKGLFGSK